MKQRRHQKKKVFCSENTIYQNLWHAGKVVLQEKFIALNICTRNEKKS